MTFTSRGRIILWRKRFVAFLLYRCDKSRSYRVRGMPIDDLIGKRDLPTGRVDKVYFFQVCLLPEFHDGCFTFWFLRMALCLRATEWLFLLWSKKAKSLVYLWSGKICELSLTELSPSGVYEVVDSSTRITDWTSQGELSYPFGWT